MKRAAVAVFPMADKEDWEMSVSIDAQVTGRVVRIEARVGDEVTVDQSLLVLESMKMEIPVEAPSAGAVSEIRVAEGDHVEEGDLLVVID